MRQIEHVSLPQTREAKEDPYAQVVDTYVKPEHPLPSEAEKIIKSIINVAPELQKYVDRQHEKHQTFSEAVGAKLYLEASGKGKDATPENIKEMLRAGELEGGAAYNRHVRNGIVKMQFKSAANQINPHLSQWYQTAQVTDRDGTLKHITEIDDVEIFDNAVTAEINKFMYERTGGKYSPTYYQEIMQGHVDKMKYNLTAHHIKERTTRTQQEVIRGSTALLDSELSSFIDDNQFVLNEENTSVKLVNMFQDFTQDQYDAGIDPELTRQTKASYLMMKMNDLDIRGIDGLLIAARMDEDLWNDGDLRVKLQATAADARKRRSEKDKEEVDAMYAEQRKNITVDLVALAQQYGDTSKIPDAILRELSDKNPLMGKQIADILDSNATLRNSTYDNSVRMEAAEYNKLLLAADSGRLSYYGAAALGHTMTANQRETLMSRAQSYENYRHTKAQRAQGGKNDYSRFAGKPEKLEAEILDTLYRRKDFTNLDKDTQRAIIEEIQNIVANKVYDQILFTEMKYGDDPKECYKQTNAIINEYFDDKKLADLIYMGNQNAGTKESVPLNVPARVGWAKEQEEALINRKGINDTNGDLRILTAKMRKPGYVPTAYDRELIRSTHRNILKGKDPKDADKEIDNILSQFLSNAQEIGKYEQ